MALRAPVPTEQESVAALVQRMGNDVSRIVRAEIGLFQLRLTAAVRVAKMGAAGVVAAAVVGLVGFAVVIAGVVLVVASILPAWLAAFAVGGVLLVVAAIVMVVEVRLLTRGVGEALSPVEETRHGE